MTTQEILKQARDAKTQLAILDSKTKNNALYSMADSLLEAKETILAENRNDLKSAKGQISNVMLDRLKLTPGRIDDMATGIRNVADLEDPVGHLLEERYLESGPKLSKISVPLGVVAIIYESRPNVTSDAAALCLKSGNVCVLRGGKEAYRTSAAVVKALQNGLVDVNLPATFVNMIEDTTRNSATELMKASGYVDLLIPRGGAGLIKACVEQSTVPCIHTGTGICTVYVDKDADFDKALKIIDNAKTQRPSVCNAAEVCLVHKDIAWDFLPLLKEQLFDKKLKRFMPPVEFRLCPVAEKIIPGIPAGKKDFDTEFLDYILGIKVVDDVMAACEHIRVHSTGHSEAIVTENQETAAIFVAQTDSAAVYVNASTRFTDGGIFGLGCEMGISTQKLHARGPMGLKELTSYKYVITGNGEIRQ